jgi:hypothetical protein
MQNQKGYGNGGMNGGIFGIGSGLNSPLEICTLGLLKFQNGFLLVALVFVIASIQIARADQDDTKATNTWTSQNSRFGLLDVFDHRSGYYADCFPQALLLDDTGLEPEGELELSYLRTEAGGQRSDSFGAEIQGSIDLLTFEVGVPYERNSDDGDVSEGIGNIEVNLRCPVYQLVSPGGFFDDTVGAGMQKNSTKGNEEPQMKHGLTRIKVCEQIFLEKKTNGCKTGGFFENGGRVSATVAVQCLGTRCESGTVAPL